MFYLLGEANRLLENTEKAEEFLYKSILMKIHPPHAYFSLGKLYQFQGRHKEAVEKFVEFLKRLENAEGHYELGRSYMWLGHFEKAIEEYSIFIEKKRHINLDPAVLILRAEAFEAIDREDLAKNDYSLVLQINPRFYDPYLEYAQELANAGRFQESKSIIDFVRSRS